MAKKWIKIVTICLLMVVFGGSVCTLLLLKTEWLYSTIEQEVLAATGYELRLTDRASLNSVFPQISFTIPTAVLRSTRVQSPSLRLRLNDVEVTLTISHLKDKPLDNLSVRVGSLTTIVDRRTKEKKTTSDEFPIVDAESLIEPFLTVVSDTNMVVTVGDLQIISRDGRDASSTYRTSSNKLSLTSGDLKISGVFHDAGKERRFSLQNHLLKAVDGISSELTLHITSDGQDPSLYSINSRQTIRGEEIEVEEFTAVGPKLNISGQLHVALQQRYRVDGTIDIRQLELMDLPVINSRQSYGIVAAEELDVKQLFSDEVVDLGRYADIDLSVSLGAVRLNNQPVVSGKILVNSSRDHFSIKSDQLLLLGGQAQFALATSAHDEEQHLTVNANIDSAQLSRLQITQDGKLLFLTGDADLKVAMKSSGNTQQKLADSLSGYFMFASSHIELSQRYAEQLDRGIVSLVMKTIKKYRKDNDYSHPAHRDGSLPLSCASLKLVINDGRVEVINGLIVDLPDNVLISSGFVDLKSETLGFAFRTKKKNIFDWSALSLVKFVELGGNLAEPKFSLDHKALLKQGLLMSSSVLVGVLPPLVYRLADAGLKYGENIECTPHLNM